MLFGYYDNYLATADNQPIVRPFHIYLTQSCGWRIGKLRKFPGLNIINDGYVPGNGEGLTILYMPKSTEEFIELMNMSWRDSTIIERLGIGDLKNDDY